MESFEPQADLAQATRSTVILNKWDSRATLHHAAIVTSEADEGKVLRLGGGCLRNCQHRVMNNVTRVQHQEAVANEPGVLQGDVHPWRADDSHFEGSVRVQTAPTMLLRFPFRRYQLVKVDTDSVDKVILEALILPRIERNEVEIDWLLVEDVKQPQVERLQRAGYAIGWLKTPHLVPAGAGPALIRDGKLIRDGAPWPLWVVETHDPDQVAQIFHGFRGPLNMVAWHKRTKFQAH